MKPSEVFAEFTARPHEVRVIAPRLHGEPVENNALRLARAMGMQIEPRAREPMTPARAFDKLPPSDALKHFPELEGAYSQLAIMKRLADKFPDQAQREQALQMARQRISTALHEGKEIQPEQGKGRTR